MEVDDNQLSLIEAKALVQPETAVQMYREIIKSPHPPATDEETKTLEGAIYGLGNLYAKLKKVSELVKLSREIRPLFQYFAKAKTAKIVRDLV